MFRVVIGMLAVGGCDAVLGLQHLSNDWLDPYHIRKGIELVPPNHTTFADFPVLIQLPADADLATNARPDGLDLVVTAGDGFTRLDVELEHYDTSGALTLWVRVPELAGVTELFLYYAGPVNDHDATATWSAQFGAVWHLGDLSLDHVADSTPGHNDALQPSVAHQPSIVQGVAGNARRGAGTQWLERQVALGDSLSHGTASFSYSAWANSDVRPSMGQFQSPFYNGATSQTDPGFDFEINMFDWSCGVADGAAKARLTADNAQDQLTARWNQIVTVVDRDAAMLTFYIDGIAIGTTALGLALPSDHANTLRLGAIDVGEGMIGAFDEVRVYNTALTAEWIATEYANIVEPQLFAIHVTPAEAKP